MLWPFCAPPPRENCSSSGYRRNDSVVQKSGCGCGGSGSIIRLLWEKNHAPKPANRRPVSSLGRSRGGLLQSNGTWEEERCTNRILRITESLYLRTIFLLCRYS